MTAIASHIQPDQTSKKNQKKITPDDYLSIVRYFLHTKNWSLNNNNKKKKGGNITNILEPDLFRVRNRKKKKSPAWQEMAARLQIDQLRTGSQLTLHLSPYPTLFYFCFPNKKQTKKKHFQSENELFCVVCVWTGNFLLSPILFLFYFLRRSVMAVDALKVTVTCSSNYYLVWVRSGYISQAPPTYTYT